MLFRGGSIPPPRQRDGRQIYVGIYDMPVSIWPVSSPLPPTTPCRPIWVMLRAISIDDDGGVVHTHMHPDEPLASVPLVAGCHQLRRRPCSLLVPVPVTRKRRDLAPAPRQRAQKRRRRTNVHSFNTYILLLPFLSLLGITSLHVFVFFPLWGFVTA